MARPHPILVELAAGRSPDRTRPIDAGIVASALEHRMSGLLWSAVESGGVELPRAQTGELAAHDLVVRAHHERLWPTATAIQDRLRRIGVETAVAKGIAAEARWYDRMGDRPSRDIDLLLDPASAHRLGDVLEALEFGSPTRHEIIRLAQSGVLQSIDLAVGGVPVDLHLDLLKIEVPTRGTSVMWDRTIVLRGPDGSSLRVLDAETSLIHFAIHMTKDRFARLLAYADVARLMAREELDWSFIDAFVRREGLRTPVYAAIQAVGHDLRLGQQPVQPPRGWRTRAWQRLWPADQRLRGYVGLGTNEHRQFWIPWLAEGRSTQALRWWVRRRALPPRDLLRVYEPDVGGPYLAQWVVGRVRGWRRRRATERLAREADARRQPRSSSPSSAA